MFPRRQFRRMRLTTMTLLLSGALLGAACQRPSSSSSNTSPGQYQGGQYQGPGQYPQQPYPQQPYPQQPYPGQPQQPAPVNPGQPQQPAPAPGPVANDPINAVDIGWMRNRSSEILVQLVNALPATKKAKVQNIPLFADPTVGEVNAFAACDDQGHPLMAISDGLLIVQANMAQFKATDEVFGTQKFNAYISFLAQNQQPGQPIVKVPNGFVDSGQHVDGRKVQRQHQLMDEQIAFVLGHELAHHHLGHTGCANGSGSAGVSPSDFGRLVSNALPLFNQPNEIGSDIDGVQNVLNAGAQQTSYRWTEGGALMTLDFFARLDQLTPATIVFGFERSHPHPLIRIPIVQQTAATWRTTGGGGLQLPFPLPF